MENEECDYIKPRKKIKSPWTAARELDLTLEVDGKRTAGQIAARMGMTRNSILSKVRRMRLRLCAPNKAWSNVRIEELRRCADEGLTMSEAAVRMETTHSAVINQARKKRIKFHPDLKNRVRAPRIRKEFVDTLYKEEPYVKGAPTTARRSPMEHPSFFTNTPTQKIMDDLANRDCRWPVADNMWCGAHSNSGSSFCPEHAFIARKK